MTDENIYWLNADSIKFLKKDYLLPGEEPLQRIIDIGNRAEALLGMPGYANKFLDYMKRGWYSLSSPIWSNFGRKRGLPISCYGSHISDTIESIAGSKLSEVAVMTKNGGGTSGWFGEVRGRGTPISSGGESYGVVHFLELYEKMTAVISQGSVRRGQFAAYLPVDHPDILEYLTMRHTSHRIQELSFGVTISDEWMESLKAGDKHKQKVWKAIIKKRFETGYPYLLWSDNVNNAAPQVYKDKGMRVNASNLCTEIMLAATDSESFVCDLASMNAVHFDDWKDTDALEILALLLDAVMTEFIDKTEDMQFMEAARNFAINQRALGIGILGWHSYLQSKMIPFESMEAKFANKEIWSTMRKSADAATEKMAKMFGEPPLLKGYGRRNVTMLAVAPTVSSSFILGQVSQGIEPYEANYFVTESAKGDFSFKNPYLINILTQKNLNKRDVWKNILTHGGSVQQLKDELTDHERAVFKTFSEISQKEIVIQAVQRQPDIDQGQSTNLKIAHGTKAREVSDLYFFAHEHGAKSLYYQKGTNPAQELARNINTCTSCEA